MLIFNQKNAGAFGQKLRKTLFRSVVNMQQLGRKGGHLKIRDVIG